MSKSYRTQEYILSLFLLAGAISFKPMGILKIQIADPAIKFYMNFYRSRAHHLIDRMSDAELEKFWTVLETAYCDVYMIKAIEDARRAYKPGDTLTREEALQLLPLLQPSPRSL